MNHPYLDSPKIIVIAGPRCSGKTHLARELAEELGLTCLSQDHIRLRIQKERNMTSEDMFSPASAGVWKEFFLEELRAVRYGDLIIEGARLAQPFVLGAFLEALRVEYGEYVIPACFFLLAPMEVRYDRFAERIKKHIRQLHEEQANPEPNREFMRTLSGFITSPFDAFPPIPKGFAVMQSGEAVRNWLNEHLNTLHPDYPVEHAGLIESIAASSSNFSPFYQTVDIGDTRIISGQTESFKTWQNMQPVDIDWQGKQVLEIGCNLGYFLLKLETLGATCEGWDIDASSVDIARMIADYCGSKAIFQHRDIDDGMQRSHDVILALNMLHYVKDFDAVVGSLCDHAEHLVFEIGETQLPDTIRVTKGKGFAVQKTLPSHRKHSVIGPRLILHLARQ